MTQRTFSLITAILFLLIALRTRAPVEQVADEAKVVGQRTRSDRSRSESTWGEGKGYSSGSYETNDVGLG